MSDTSMTEEQANAILMDPKTRNLVHCVVALATQEHRKLEESVADVQIALAILQRRLYDCLHERLMTPTAGGPQ